MNHLNYKSVVRIKKQPSEFGGQRYQPKHKRKNTARHLFYLEGNYVGTFTSKLRTQVSTCLSIIDSKTYTLQSLQTCKNNKRLPSYHFSPQTSPPSDLQQPRQLGYVPKHHLPLEKCRSESVLVEKLMGGKSSKRSTSRHPSFGTASRSWSHQSYQEAPYAQPPLIPSYAPPSQDYRPQQYYAPPPQSHGSAWPTGSNTGSGTKFGRINDDYNSLDQVTDALARAGLESSNLIVGIDFTKSNEWTGARSFHRKSLHHIGEEQNPYEQGIAIIGKTLSSFDEDNLIPCFGFGDASTHDQEVFSFYPDEGSYCNGFEEVLRRYRELVPQLRLAGPTSFAPIIEMGITIVEQSGGQYHVLVIIADGQVTRSVDTGRGQLSPQERKTVEAIVKASEYPLSIILVGVGDGPWDMMKEFDDNIPARVFDNFQFVNFTEIMAKNMDRSRKEAEFALAALMEIPSQYKATLELNILGATRGKAIDRVPLPPPHYGSSSFSSPKTSRSSSFRPSAPSRQHDEYVSTAHPAGSTSDNNVCPICLTDPKNMAFGCGHQTCCDCGQDLDLCPICRTSIITRIKLY